MTSKVISITNDTSTITLTAANGQHVVIQKQDAKLKYTSEDVFIYDCKLTTNTPTQIEDDCYLLNYLDITTPASASNLALANTIKTYLNS